MMTVKRGGRTGVLVNCEICGEKFEPIDARGHYNASIVACSPECKDAVQAARRKESLSDGHDPSGSRVQIKSYEEKESEMLSDDEIYNNSLFNLPEVKKMLGTTFSKSGARQKHQDTRICGGSDFHDTASGKLKPMGKGQQSTPIHTVGECIEGKVETCRIYIESHQFWFGGELDKSKEKKK